jgi:hypothetical protein
MIAIPVLSRMGRLKMQSRCSQQMLKKGYGFCAITPCFYWCRDAESNCGHVDF